MQVRPNLDHPLNHGRILWLVGTPGASALSSSSGLFDLMRERAATISGYMTWGRPTRRGGYAQLDYVAVGTPQVTNNTGDLSMSGLSAFSAGCWAYRTSAAGYGRIIGVEPGYVNGWTIAFDGLGTSWVGQREASSVYQSTGTTSLPANTWTHVMMTFDGSTIRTYNNGVAGPTVSSNVSIPTGTTAMRFNDNGGTCSLDSISVWNRALTGSEVAALYAEELMGYPSLFVRPRRPKYAAVAAAAPSSLWMIGGEFPSLGYVEG